MHDLSCSWTSTWADDEAHGDEVNVHDHTEAPHFIVPSDHRIGLKDQTLVQLLTFADRRS